MSKITVIGWPRSGTHYLKSLLELSTGLEIHHSHSFPKPEEDNLYVLTTRDPRDAFVSHYILEHNKRSQIEHVRYFFMGEGMNQPHLAQGWVGYMKEWLSYPAHVMTSHEIIMQNPMLTIYHIVKVLNLPLSTARIKDSIRYLNNKRCDPSDLPPCNNLGIVGRWVSFLEKEAHDLLISYCGSMMEKLGYE